MDTSPGPPPTPASPKSVCTRGGGGSRQVRPTLVGPFFHLHARGRGWVGSFLTASPRCWVPALLTRGPATQHLPRQPLPACHT